MMKNQKSKIKSQILVKVIFLLLVACGLLLVPQTHAAEATLYFAPGGGTRYVGSLFSIAVKVNSTQIATNAYQADLFFPTDKLMVTNVSTGGSICTLWVSQPSYDNNAGRISFSCGLPTPGFSGSAGTIGNVTFRAKTTGNAYVGFADSSKVLANDGKGTNVVGGKGGGTFTIVSPPTAAPKVSSDTHPDEGSWYKEKRVHLTWNKEAETTGFSFEFNQLLETIPDDISEDIATEKVYENIEDGIWYFHLKAKSAGEWSATSHFRIQIDTTPPDGFTPVAEPPDETDTPPTISFAATDSGSGIDHYELKIDDSEYATAESPYKISTITSGKHTVFVKAIDKAGNFTEDSVEISIRFISPPSITKPSSKSYLPLGEKLAIEGTTQTPGKVKLYLNGVQIAELEIGEDKKFSYTYPEFLRPQKYSLYASLLTDKGVESSPSDVVGFTVDAKAIKILGLVLPGWLVFGLLLGVIALLLVLAGLLWQRIRRYRLELKLKLHRLEEEVEEELEELEETVEKALPKDGLRKKLKGKIKEATKGIKERFKKESEEN